MQKNEWQALLANIKQSIAIVKSLDLETTVMGIACIHIYSQRLNRQNALKQTAKKSNFT
ncbi:MAG: hypothetical protein HOP02_16795 [Methylococcaceae bacterium]|nr:hypothetical protein [Methylococcaceae bacterium]